MQIFLQNQVTDWVGELYLSFGHWGVTGEF